MSATLQREPKVDWREPEAAARDEMWNGVLYMPPMPNRMHQNLSRDLMIFLQLSWAKPNGGRVHQEVNLTTPDDEADWTFNYRIPDLVLLAPDRFMIDKDEYMAGAPLVCIEIHSMGDRSDDKLEFDSGLGVPEVWIIDRSSRHPEVFVLTEATYINKPFDADGGLWSAATGVEFRRTDDGKLKVRIGSDDAASAIVPEYGHPNPAPLRIG